MSMFVINRKSYYRLHKFNFWVLLKPLNHKKNFMLNSFVLINVKMPTIVGILTFMSRSCWNFNIYEQEKIAF